jgi:hypothetical protein
MQYTASSFASPILRFFTAILRTRESVTPVQGPFPAPARLEVETSDVFENMLFESPAKSVAARMNVFRKKVQHGHMNLYVLYIAITLLALLLWKLS